MFSYVVENVTPYEERETKKNFGDTEPWSEDSMFLNTSTFYFLKNCRRNENAIIGQPY